MAPFDSRHGQTQGRCARSHVDRQHGGRDQVEGDHGVGRACHPESRNRTPAEDEQRRDRERGDGADHRDDSRRAHVARAAKRRAQEVRDPGGDGGGEDEVGVEQRVGERVAFRTERPEERRAAEPCGRGEHRAERDRDDDRVRDQGLRVFRAACTQRTRDGRRDAAAHAAVGHHRHQHEEREDEGHARDGAGAEEAHEPRLRHAHQRLHHEHDEHRPRHAQQRARDRAFEDLLAGHEAWRRGTTRLPTNSWTSSLFWL